MATISTRPKSPPRAEAISKALKSGPVFSTRVLLGKLSFTLLSYHTEMKNNQAQL